MRRWPTCGWISQDQWEWNRMETSGKQIMAELWVRETDGTNGNRENSGYCGKLLLQLSHGIFQEEGPKV